MIEAIERTQHGPTSLAVLFADISGSTQLYEVHGDALARETVAESVEVLSEIAAKHRGRVVKTIGDEVMCAFGDPVQAILAAQEMQAGIRRAGEEGRFRTGAVRIKVGFHYGGTIEEADDLHGDAPGIAQELIGMAKAEQILTSQDTLEMAPEEFLVSTRRIGRVPMRDGAREVDVYEVIWDVTGVTMVADSRPVSRRRDLKKLALRYGDQHVVLDVNRTQATVGRVEDRDLVVNSGLTSRQHAEINFRVGRFRIEDYSANGTVVVTDEGRVTTLRRETHSLRGKGRICFGGTPETNPEGIVYYETE